MECTAGPPKAHALFPYLINVVIPATFSLRDVIGNHDDSEFHKEEFVHEKGCDTLVFELVA